MFFRTLRMILYVYVCIMPLSLGEIKSSITWLPIKYLVSTNQVISHLLRLRCFDVIAYVVPGRIVQTIRITLILIFFHLLTKYNLRPSTLTFTLPDNPEMNLLDQGPPTGISSPAIKLGHQLV